MSTEKTPQISSKEIKSLAGNILESEMLSSEIYNTLIKQLLSEIVKNEIDKVSDITREKIQILLERIANVMVERIERENKRNFSIPKILSFDLGMDEPFRSSNQEENPTGITKEKSKENPVIAATEEYLYHLGYRTQRWYGKRNRSTDDIGIYIVELDIVVLMVKTQSQPRSVRLVSSHLLEKIASLQLDHIEELSAKYPDIIGRIETRGGKSIDILKSIHHLSKNLSQYAQENNENIENFDVPPLQNFDPNNNEHLRELFDYDPLSLIHDHGEGKTIDLNRYTFINKGKKYWSTGIRIAREKWDKKDPGRKESRTLLDEVFGGEYGKNKAWGEKPSEYFIFDANNPEHLKAIGFTPDILRDKNGKYHSPHQMRKEFTNSDRKWKTTGRTIMTKILGRDPSNKEDTQKVYEKLVKTFKKGEEQ